MKRPSLHVFGLVSALLAGWGLVLSIREDMTAHLYLSDGSLAVLPYSLAWSGWVYWAYRVHGKRAAWLLIGLPFAWLEPLLFALFVIGHMLMGGGV